jgi:hypothetical protein
MKQREKGKRVMKRVRPWRLGFLMEDPDSKADKEAM